MNLAMRMAPGADVRLEYAEITARTDQGFLVKSPSGLAAAIRAAGCLLGPEVGDLVLCAEDAAGTNYVLAVLSRASDGPARVGAEGGLILGESDAPLTLRGANVGLEAAGDLELAASRINATAAEAGIKILRLCLAGEAVTACFERAKGLFGAAERLVGRFVSRARRVYRRVDEFEDARYERLRQETAGSMDLLAGTARLRAQGNVDVEGKRINLG